jgi:hypothetical protein
MTQPARPDPGTTTGRMTVAAKDLASDLTEGIRKSDRYSRLRAAVVGTWAILALMTFWVACPSSGPGNSLGAVVQLLPESIMGTQILVHNDSERLWTDVVFTVDGAWKHQRKTIRGGDKVVLPVEQFSRDGEAAPRGLKPKELVIECEQGKVTAPLGGRRP